jgi:hypothetical protein
VKGRPVLQKDGYRAKPALTLLTQAGQAQRTRNPTTSFLTATTLIYAIGAGITAAAGTRLALQWILVKGFKLYSFQLPDLKRPGIVIFCHYLSVSELGNLRACCLPWMW